MNEEQKPERPRMESLEKGIEKAYDSVISDYLDYIKKDYSLFPKAKKVVLLEGLEKLVEKLGNMNYKVEQDKVGYVRPVYEGKTFDGKIAREIREKEGLTQREAAAYFGISYSLLVKAEKNEIKHPQKNARRKTYLLWLKENGYDPFNIKIEDS